MGYTINRRAFAGLTSLLPAGFLISEAQARPMDDIIKKGVLRVGIHPNSPPFSARDASGAFIGFDIDVANRMADYGVDPYWLSHEPWIVAEPFTPEAGEMYSKEDIDTWIDVIARIAQEAYGDPAKVKAAPHAQAIRKIRGEPLEDPARWAMTWRAYKRKRGQ